MEHKRLLHLDWSPDLNSSWILRVMSALHACKSPTVRERFSRWDRDKRQELTLGDLAITVAAKLAVIPLIVRRVDTRLNDIARVLQSDRNKVETCLQDRVVYRLPDRRVAQEAVIDFDSFLFESESTYEITALFLRRFFDVVLGKQLGTGSRKDAARHIEEALQVRGAQTRWVDEMRRKRNLLIHARAVWLAFEVVGGSRIRFDPVLLTRPVERIQEDPDHISIEQLRFLWQGFVASYEQIEAWLKEEVAALDKRLDSTWPTPNTRPSSPG